MNNNKFVQSYWHSSDILKSSCQNTSETIKLLSLVDLNCNILLCLSGGLGAILTFAQKKPHQILPYTQNYIVAFGTGCLATQDCSENLTV